MTFWLVIAFCAAFWVFIAIEEEIQWRHHLARMAKETRERGNE